MCLFVSAGNMRVFLYWSVTAGMSIFDLGKRYIGNTHKNHDNLIYHFKKSMNVFLHNCDVVAKFEKCGLEWLYVNYSG